MRNITLYSAVYVSIVYICGSLSKLFKRLSVVLHILKPHQKAWNSLNNIAKRNATNPKIHIQNSDKFFMTFQWAAK